MTWNRRRKLILIHTWTNPLWLQPYVPSSAQTIIHIDSPHLFSHETPSPTHTHTHTPTGHMLGLVGNPPPASPGLQITTSSHVAHSCAASPGLTFVAWPQRRSDVQAAHRCEGLFSLVRPKWTTCCKDLWVKIDELTPDSQQFCLESMTKHKEIK